jgi:hypothetical protein
MTHRGISKRNKGYIDSLPRSYTRNKIHAQNPFCRVLSYPLNTMYITQNTLCLSLPGPKSKRKLMTAFCRADSAFWHFSRFKIHVFFYCRTPSSTLFDSGPGKLKCNLLYKGSITLLMSLLMNSSLLMHCGCCAGVYV